MNKLESLNKEIDKISKDKENLENLRKSIDESILNLEMFISRLERERHELLISKTRTVCQACLSMFWYNHHHCEYCGQSHKTKEHLRREGDKKKFRFGIPVD